jgi:hypothetical protein
MRNAVLAGAGGVKGALANGFIYIFTGAQPTNADTAAGGVMLGKVTKDGDNVTGINLGTPINGIILKDDAEDWRFEGLADGAAGWWRYCEPGDTPAAASSTKNRIDGSIGTAGADANIANTNVVTGAVSTVDEFSITMPGA